MQKICVENIQLYERLQDDFAAANACSQRLRVKTRRGYNDLAEGIYLVTLYEGNKISSKKIIVER